MKVLIVVTHLLGTGHLARALTLARAFGDQGHDTVVVSGGMPAPHLDTTNIELEQLPPVRSNGIDFSTLFDGSDQSVDGLYMDQRQHALIAILNRVNPDVLITELFPFGRRILKDEFTALLSAAETLSKPPLIVSSIRDILAPPSKPAKAALADTLIDTYYDAVLVHADADLTPLELSWPVSSVIADKLHYTGFVAPPPAPHHPEGIGTGEILVSAGGGDVGGHIFAAALKAADQHDRKWRLLLGGADAKKRADAMQAIAPKNVTVEPARPDFRQMLYHAHASVCMCGYNTALDVLQSGVSTVFIPFDEGSEVEQGIRADALAKQSNISVIRSVDLTSERLLQALGEVEAEPSRHPIRTGMDGAARTVDIIDNLQEIRRES